MNFRMNAILYVEKVSHTTPFAPKKERYEKKNFLQTFKHKLT